MVVFEPTIRPWDGSVELQGLFYFERMLRVGEECHAEPI
jgi:hypothetical protein